MKIDDFRCMNRGIQQGLPQEKDTVFLKGLEQKSTGHHKALLLLHGFSSTPAVYRNMLPALQSYDALVAPALPGHASSIEAFSHCTAQEWLAFVENCCKKLNEEYEQVDVVGLSLGGLLACYLSQSCTINHLYLLAPALDLNLNLKRNILLGKILRRLGFRYLRSKGGNLCDSKAYEICYRQLPINTILEVLSLIEQSPFNIPTCPTDVFLGRFDEVVNSDKVAQRLGGRTNIEIHWLENSAHVLPLE